VVDQKEEDGQLVVTFTGQLSDLWMFATTAYEVTRPEKTKLVINLVQNGVDYMFAILRDGDDEPVYLRFHTNEPVEVDGVIIRHCFPSQK
jgi:hypothetical protein